jgi:TatD DNase family protein
MQLTDSHCHLADKRLYPDLDEILSRARLAGVMTIISVGSIGPIESDLLTVEIAERTPGVRAVIGVHPHHAMECTDQRLDQLRELASSPRVVAIGESGLDFHYMYSPAEVQESSLRRHLELATELDKPIVIHCRKAEERVAAIIAEVAIPPRGGVIHCFTGDAAAADTFLRLGFYISLSGILTFRNAKRVRDAARHVPLDRLLIETDAPYLAPEPYRGRRNEPAFVTRTLEVLAEIHQINPELLAEKTHHNARCLFGLDI